jgi:endonuclease YncB( thermonuclease family)
MKLWCLWTAIVALAAVAGIVSAQQVPPIVGTTFVIDGDTIDVAGVRIRIYGIDAPESDQLCRDDKDRPYRCGSLATDALIEETGTAQVTCQRQDTDKYGRTVAICFAYGRNLGEDMVMRGYAVDYTFFSHGKYRDAQESARRDRRGLWAGTFDMPWDWRRSHRGRMR